MGSGLALGLGLGLALGFGVWLGVTLELCFGRELGASTQVEGTVSLMLMSSATV